MKKFLQLLTAATLILSGCAAQSAPVPEQTVEIPSAVHADTVSMEISTAPEPDPAIEKYIDVLEGIYYDQVLPDGQRLELYPQYFEEAPNEFAIFDIDSDGEDELLVRYINTYTAGMFGAVYGYDRTENRLTTQLMEFPALSFYKNGTVEAGWSHNQGLAGRFWPCTLYRYDASSDTYFPYACVDAWDREFFETDFDGNSFPAQADPEGHNIVYYISLYGHEEQPAPVSQSEFETWYNEFINFDPSADSHELFAVEIPYLPLTEQNILSIPEE